MKVFVASSVCWTIATSWRTSPCAMRGIALHEALHDLGLEHDVGQALGRAVVHRPGDLAAQVLLGGEDDPRERGRQRPSSGVRGRRPRRRSPSTAARRVQARRPAPGSAMAVPVAGERLALALQDVDLGLHEGGAPGERDQRCASGLA